MKFSTRTLYGLKAILVLASRHGEGSMSASMIAKKEDISVAYLEQILNALKRKGFVKSVRGPQGGYVLAKKPSEISLEALFSVLVDKNFFELMPKFSITAQSDETGIANYIFWQKMKNSLEKGLAQTSLKDLVDEARRLKRSKNPVNPSFNI